jgi:hypothetical protein
MVQVGVYPSLSVDAHSTSKIDAVYKLTTWLSWQRMSYADERAVKESPPYKAELKVRLTHETVQSNDLKSVLDSARFPYYSHGKTLFSEMRYLSHL